MWAASLVAGDVTGGVALIVVWSLALVMGTTAHACTTFSLLMAKFAAKVAADVAVSRALWVLGTTMAVGSVIKIIISTWTWRVAGLTIIDGS